MDFSFKMLFLAFLGEKTPKFYPAGPMFHVLLMKYLSNCTYSKKLSLS